MCLCVYPCPLPLPPFFLVFPPHGQSPVPNSCSLIDHDKCLLQASRRERDREREREEAEARQNTSCHRGHVNEVPLRLWMSEISTCVSFLFRVPADDILFIGLARTGCAFFTEFQVFFLFTLPLLFLLSGSKTRRGRAKISLTIENHYQ